MIVDTSVLIAILHREADARELSRRLLGSRQVLVSAGTLLETRMVAAREAGGAELDKLLRKFGAEVISVDERQIAVAYEAFQRFGKGKDPAGLNFGDLFAYSLAKMQDAPLLYKGDDFSQTDVKAA